MKNIKHHIKEDKAEYLRAIRVLKTVVEKEDTKKADKKAHQAARCHNRSTKDKNENQ